MDTVSMLNTMSFYCQPILPLVYDESMSYYETLCKVVGQLNNTGETVNKLNERLTAEIADREAGDAALDARIKQIEETTRKIHFLKVDTLGHLLTADVTREKLSQWVQNGDIIAMLYAPDELENSWAVATNYRSMGAARADTMQLNFYVPVSITNNAGKSGSDVAQEVVVISLPTGALTNQWAVRHITTTIPRTNADGFVNLTATVSDAGAVTCDVEPGAIVEALRNYFSGTNQYAVAVNARLNYDGKQYHSGAATVKADAPGAGNIRIAFENYWDGVRAENGVRQTTNTTVLLVGDVKTNAWSVETIDHKTFDFSRYEGFQFTRGAHDVITTNDESTPNAVYAQYHSDTSGKLYQNLPTRLIDSVDGAEYWNGTFDIYGGNHMTFTFVTSNYATASDKMLVRVIELSADVGTTAWKYGVKEFTLPLSGAGAVTYVDFWPTGSAEEYSKDLKAWTISLDTNQTFDAIFDLISSGTDVVARLYKDSTKAELVAKSIEAQLSGDKTLGNINFSFVHAANDVFLGFPTIADAIWVTKTANSTSTYALYKWCALPVPAGDSTDNGKVPTVNGTEWELKDPTSKPLYITIDVTNIDERIYTLTDGNKTYTVEEIYEAKENGTPVFISPADIGAYFQVLDFSFSNTAFKAFFLNVVRRTDMSYGRLILSTIGGQTKGTYNVEGFLATASSANNGKFLKMKQDGSGIEYVVAEGADFVINATLKANGTAALDKTFEQIHEAVAAGKTTIVHVGGLGAEESYLQLSTYTSDYVTFLNTGLFHTADAAVVFRLTVRTNSANYVIRYLPAGAEYGSIPQVSMSSDPNDPMEISTKKYVDDHKSDGAVLYTEQTLTTPQQFQARKNIGALGNVSPNIKNFMIITPPNEADGIGVSLAAMVTDGDFVLDFSDANEGKPTLLTGVKTPTDADTNAAATVEFVKNKAKKKVWIDVDAEDVKSFNYTDIDNEITNGGSNVWLRLGTEQLRMVACNKSGASSYELTFVNLDGANFNIHTVTVSASAAEYSVTVK